MEKKRYLFAVGKACRSLKEGEKELWTLTVSLKDLPRNLKYGPNARYASLDSKPAKEMLATLAADPETFVYKNNGIMLVAQSIRVEGNAVDLTCEESDGREDDELLGHGVLNGGHTYKVLEHALESKDERFADALEKTNVMITVAIGVSPDDIAGISRARNTSQSVPLHALRNLDGDWTAVHKHLPARLRRLVAFKPNDPEAPDAEYDTTDLVRRLALINNEMFPAERGIHPVTAYTSIGSLVKQYKEDRFTAIAPLLPDVLHLEELVVRHWESISGRGPGKIVIANASGCSAEPQTLLTGYKSDLTLADPFVLPVMAAFRVFVKDGQWLQPVDTLWEKYGPRTVEALWDAYKQTGKSSAAFFGRAKASWATACDLTKSAALQHGMIKVD